MNILYIAAAIVSIIGLKFLSPFLIYLILSLFLTILIYPLINFFEKRGLPIFIGYFFVSVLVVLIFSAMFFVINTSLKEFLSNYPIYHQKFTEFIKSFNLEMSLFSISDVVPIVKMFLAKAGNLLSGFLIVFIGVSFMIFEFKNFGKKVSLITKNTQNFEIFFKNIQNYFVIKTFTSFLTGLFITLMLLYFKLPYAYLFGILAFFFNFIPVIGSIIASIPAILLALISFEIEITIYIAIGYLIINNLISNVIEPKIMGEGLDLSPAVVFFSLLLWGWVFGIVGMFLAAPLTMTLKLALLSNERTKWLGVLLSK